MSVVNSKDGAVLTYLGILAGIFGCALTAYVLVASNAGASQDNFEVSVNSKTVVGLIASTINAFSINILAQQLSDRFETFPRLVRIGIPLVVFAVTFGLVILFALN
jgi:hypothetical protein